MCKEFKDERKSWSDKRRLDILEFEVGLLKSRNDTLYNKCEILSKLVDYCIGEINCPLCGGTMEFSTAIKVTPTRYIDTKEFTHTVICEKCGVSVTQPTLNKMFDTLHSIPHQYKTLTK